MRLPWKHRSQHFKPRNDQQTSKSIVAKHISLGITQTQRFWAFVKVGTYRKSMKPEITEIDHHPLLFPLTRWASSFLNWNMVQATPRINHLWQQSVYFVPGLLLAGEGWRPWPSQCKDRKINFDSLIKSKCTKCTSPQEPFESSVIWRAHAIWRYV